MTEEEYEDWKLEQEEDHTSDHDYELPEESE
jgi:hypothetical protein